MNRLKSSSTHYTTFFSSKYLLSRFSLSLLLPAMVLVAISLATFYSIDPLLFRSQAIFFIGSLAVYFIFLNLDYRIFGLFSKHLYIGIIFLLLLLLFIGFEAKGAVRWVSIFGVSIQFSELIKPFYIIVLAYFLSRDNRRSFSKFFMTLLLLLPIFLLTLKQPDLGNAIIYVLITFAMMVMYGFPLLFFAVTALVIAIPLPVLFNLLHSYQRARLLSFINVGSDPFGSSYNAIQALISVGSGGLSGKGFGYATQSALKFLPERHTDFIYATISENLGFVGSVMILSIFFILLYKIYKISWNIDDTFSYLIVMGFYFLLFVHIFFNIGMNIGILPIVGITLPFVSYGGSSLLTNFIILGILSSVNFEFKRRQSIEIR